VALVAGFQRALLAGSVVLLAAALIATRATNTRGATVPNPSLEPLAIPETG
jgi:hypothetical protein